MLACKGRSVKHTVVMSQGWPEVFSESLLLPDPGNVFSFSFFPPDFIYIRKPARAQGFWLRGN